MIRAPQDWHRAHVRLGELPRHRAPVGKRQCLTSVPNPLESMPPRRCRATLERQFPKLRLRVARNSTPQSGLASISHSDRDRDFGGSGTVHCSFCN
jgi:hypothetical protein